MSCRGRGALTKLCCTCPPQRPEEPKSVESKPEFQKLKSVWVKTRICHVVPLDWIFSGFEFMSVNGLVPYAFVQTLFCCHQILVVVAAFLMRLQEIQPVPGKRHGIHTGSPITLCKSWPELQRASTCCGFSCSFKHVSHASSPCHYDWLITVWGTCSELIWWRLQDFGAMCTLQNMCSRLRYNFPLFVATLQYIIWNITYLEQTCVRVETLLVLLAVEVKRSKVEQAVRVPWLNIECSYIERLRLYE